VAVDEGGLMSHDRHGKLVDIVLLSTADWDNPFWTNKQHVAQELARRGHRVLYVDSLGLRRPSATGRDLRRILRRLFRALRPPRAVRDRLWVWSPVVIPLQKFSAVRWMNKALLSAGLLLWCALLRIRRQLLWTYNPMTTRLFPASGFDKVVYHCVDEIKAQPGMPSQTIEESEAELLEAAGLCFVTAEHLLETRRALNLNTHYFPNVADFEHFSATRAPATTIPADLARLPRPRVGFIGAISGYKLDFALLRHLSQTHPEWSIVLIGEVGEGDPWTDLAPLRSLPNVHLLGPRSYAKLPAYLKGFDVAMLPSALNTYTQGMFPMKFFEYLAAGCPVVSTDLPALRSYAGVATLAKTHDEFVSAIERILTGEAPALGARLGVAREHTYARRTERMMALVEAQ
jgi:glycosyltransferase involved in cell wall biosynthesis